MKVETVALMSIRWGIILPVVGSCLIAAGVVAYAAAMVTSLGAAEVDVTKLPIHP